MAKELEKIAWGIRRQVSSHHGRLAEFKQRINELQHGQDTDEMLKALADEAEHILTPTLRLAGQIASAYDRIREQTDHLTTMAGSRTDPLTGIANRQRVEETLADQFASMRRYHTGFAVALFDIDQFHRINDAERDLNGDVILQELAASLADVARETDIVARFDAQAFVILMPQTDLEGASYFGERYREAVDGLGSVTVSGGVTIALEGDDSGSLLHRLEDALQAAKHDGGNTVYRHDGIRIETVVEPAEPELAAG